MLQKLLIVAMLAGSGSIAAWIAAPALLRPANGRAPAMAALPVTQAATEPTVASAIPGLPANLPYSPRGWILNAPGYTAFLPRIVVPGPGPGGFRDQEAGAMVGATHFGDNMFHSPSLTVGPKAGLYIVVNGPSSANFPGGSAWGMGPSSPGGNFTLAGGVTVTAVP